jgi:hypothetical protein
MPLFQPLKFLTVERNLEGLIGKDLKGDCLLVSWCLAEETE